MPSRLIGHVVEVAQRIRQLQSIVGGTIPHRKVSSVAIASTAPAAPNMCPVMDFVEDTINLKACSPNTLLIASVSARSF